jgi:2-keto-3-deoxy-galactonokinase
LVEAGKHAGVPLLHRLFQSRSLRLDQQLSSEGAASWTSGLLIGTDCSGALPLFDSTDGPVHIIATDELAALYATALARLGRQTAWIAGDEAAFAGLARIHAALATG